jgi:hypothetical protein
MGGIPNQVNTDPFGGGQQVGSQPTNTGGSPFGSSLGAGISGILGTAGNIFNSLGGTNATTKQATQGTSTSTPNLSPLQSYIQNILSQYGQQTFNQQPDLSGYLSQGLSANNTSGNQNRNQLRSTLASRGLSDSPLAGSEETALDQNQANQNTNLSNSVPLLQKQLQLASAPVAGNLLGEAFGPVAQTTNQTGSVVGSGQTGGNANNGIGSALGGIGSVIGTLASLFGL